LENEAEGYTFDPNNPFNDCSWDKLCLIIFTIKA
jgi:hypothetical protein